VTRRVSRHIHPDGQMDTAVLRRLISGRDANSHGILSDVWKWSPSAVAELIFLSWRHLPNAAASPHCLKRSLHRGGQWGRTASGGASRAYISKLSRRMRQANRVCRKKRYLPHRIPLDDQTVEVLPSLATTDSKQKFPLCLPTLKRIMGSSPSHNCHPTTRLSPPLLNFPP